MLLSLQKGIDPPDTFQTFKCTALYTVNVSDISSLFLYNQYIVMCLSINDFTTGSCYCFCRNRQHDIHFEQWHLMVYVSLCYFDGWDTHCRIQPCGRSIATSYCLISHRSIMFVLAFNYINKELSFNLSIWKTGVDGDCSDAVALWDEKWVKPSQSSNSPWLDLSVHLSLWHTHGNIKTVMDANRSYSFQCHIHAHIAMLFHSIPLFISVFVVLFDAVFFPLPSVHPPASFVSVSLLPCVTLSFTATHSPSLALCFTVKPFQGPLVLKHHRLSCQMHRSGEESILFTADQKTKPYRHIRIHLRAHPYTHTVH